MASLKRARPLPQTWGALAVVLATLGCTPPRQQASVELTQAMRYGLPLPGSPSGMLSYLASGNDAADTRPRLILVHGTPGSAQAWTDYIVNPPTGIEVVALDRPGFGQSQPQAAQVSLAEQAQAVAALLAPAPRQNILLGHSLGGPIVAWLAAKQADRVAALILVAASLDPGQEKIHPMQRVGDWLPVRALLSRSLRNANSELLALEPELRALQPLLAKISAPTYILHGEQDNLVPVANVHYMQSQLTRTRSLKTVLLPQRNHFLPWNSQAEMREAIAWGLAQASDTTRKQP
jgi:pimeloyl-ACP methyl ester carboxylesterase